MLLTLSPPGKTDFGVKPSHDLSPPFPRSASRFAPDIERRPYSALPLGDCWTMSSSHRGLPPPSSMTLPDPNRGPPSLAPPMGQMPAPPSQWQGAEESMRNWLHAKAEEDKRKQEEEKTRQETLKLEQRKIEHSMLRESMQGGIPAPLVPVIFAGIGGSNLASTSLEWAQQYMAQLQQAVAQQQFQQQQEQQQQQQQQQQHFGRPQVSPELRRETRSLGQAQSSMYPPTSQHPPPPPPSQVPLATASQGQALSAQVPYGGPFTTPPYHLPTMSPTSRARTLPESMTAAGPAAVERPPTHSSLPRLTTNDLQVHQPPDAQPSLHPLHQTHSAQPGQHQEQTSSPSIYFHHWVPPASHAGSSQQTSARSREPASSHLSASHLSEVDYSNSPKKRKSHAAHPPGSTPLSGRQASPPPLGASTASSTPRRMAQAHSRHRSNTAGHESRRSLPESASERERVAERRVTWDRSRSVQDTRQSQQPQRRSADPDRASAPASPKREPEDSRP